MYDNRTYLRKFIMLEPNTVRYLKDKDKLKGYAKIEIRDGRGKVQLSIEAAKSLETDGVYVAGLFSNVHEQPVKVDIGNIILNKNGKGNLTWQFNPESVAGTNIPIDKFNTIFVQFYKNNSKEIAIPLFGYIWNKDDSINKLIDSIESKKFDPNNKTDVENKTYELSNKVEKSAEYIEYDEKQIQDNQIPVQEKTEKENEQKGNEYLEIENEEDIFVKDKDIENTSQHKTDGFKYEANSDDNKYGHSINVTYDYTESSRSYSRHIANYSLNILKFFEKVDPLRERLKGYTWWEIEYDRKNFYRGFLPFYNYIINTYYPYQFNFKATTCQSLIRKYGHYIFGIVEENGEIKYYVYGIPGRFTKDEQPYRGMTGFTTWIPRKGRNRERIGYWLLHIDAINGRIVSPLKPTYPR